MQDDIVVVSGLPRSGTSMMMKMLQAGGVDIVSDGKRTSDEHNTEGYFEFERVKALKTDHRWLLECRGKAVKIISHLLHAIPPGLQYKVVFVRRNMDEILLSQKKMYQRLQQQPDTVPDNVLATKFSAHLIKIENWMRRRKDLDFQFVHYSHVVKDPASGAEIIQRFLNRPMDLDKMAAAVNPELYRNRSGGDRFSEMEAP